VERDAEGRIGHERFGIVRVCAALVIVIGLILMNGPTVYEPVRVLSR
jgi:hypothetical protein